MKILHLISGGDGGGAKTALYSLFSALGGHADISVEVCCLTDGVFYRGLAPLGVPHILIRQRSRLDMSAAGKIADHIRSYGFDLLHAHGARANFIACRVKKLVDVPILTTLHSDYRLDYTAPVKRMLFTPVASAALRGIPYRIAVSEEFRRMLIRRGFEPNSIFTVYNGLDTSSPAAYLSRKDALDRLHLHLPEVAVTVGCAARLDRVKGADVLLRAAAAVISASPRVHFLFAGDGTEKKRLVRLARRLRLGQNVHFLGHLDDMDAFYSAIDINAIPSRSESFPYSMLEGARYALPAVASAVGGIPDFIRDGSTGLLFPSEDAAALADAILRLIASPELAKRLGEAAKEKLVSEFTSENTAKAHEKIYRAVLARERERKADGKACDFLLSGYYGYGNIGDDAVLAAIIASIRKHRPDATFTVLSRRPRQTATTFGVNARFRYGAAVRSALRVSRVLISGGGTLMQDKTSSRSLRYYLSVIRRAKRLGVPVMQYANGFGPLSPSGRDLAVKTVNDCVSVITARDADALDAMKAAGVSVRALLCADPVLLSPPAKKSLHLKEKSYIAVSLCGADGACVASKLLSDAANALSERLGLPAVFLVMHEKEDLAVFRYTGGCAGEIFIPRDACEAYSLLAGASLALTVRLHATVFSVMSEVPTVAVACDEKVSGFCRHAGLSTCLEADALTIEAVTAAALSALSRRKLDISRLRELAEVSAAEAAKLLDKTKKQP